MTAFKHNTFILFCLLFHYYGTAQICEDSIQSYSLYSSYKIEHIGGSFQQLQNGYTANIAWVITPTGRKLAILLTDKDGRFVRAKYIELADPTYTLYLPNIIEAPGNNLIAYGKLLTSGGTDKGVVIIKFDSDLTLQWSTLVRRNIAEPETGSYYLWGLHCDEQSNLYFSFSNVPSIVIQPTVFFVSVDAGGILRWSKGINMYSLPSSTFSFNAITSIDNKVFFLGNYEYNVQPGLIGVSVDRNTGSFIKMNSAVLNIVGNVTAASIYNQNIRLWPRSKDFYYAFGVDEYNPNQRNIVHVLIDTGFTITRARIFRGKLWAYSWRQFNLGKSGSISFLGIGDLYIRNDHFAVVDSAGNTVISKKAGNGFFNMPEFYPAIISQDEQRLSLSVGNGPALDSMKRISLPLNGDTSFYSCLGKDTSFFSIEDITLTKTDINPGIIYSNVVQLSALGIQTSDFTFQKQEFCKVKSVCSNLQISGNIEFCTGTPQVFKAQKNDGCLKKIYWQLDGIPASLVNQTDSTVTLQFYSSWNGTIVAGIQGCDLTAALPVVVREPLTAFSLGNEKIICAGDSVTLSAPEGYLHYQWSTGDTVSLISVATPATYTVMVTDHCGNTVSSSVSIKHPPLQISPVISDTDICKGDSVFITLPTSLSSVTWSPSVTAIGNNSFYTLPVTSSAYTIQAKDEYDCPYSDRFMIIVNPCTEQLWVPNAFSPNGDYLNDTFGATTDGRLRSFSLAVYNRWGEQVFSTANPAIKWDGKLKGRPAIGGVYVWMCKYQFLQGPLMTTKGTVVLIR